jgi:hypothetical protein
VAVQESLRILPDMIPVLPRRTVLLAIGLSLVGGLGAYLEMAPPEFVPGVAAAGVSHDAQSVPGAEERDGSAIAAPAPRRETLTDIRRRLFDAPDVLAAVQWARAHGTADEKELAVDVFRECYAYGSTPLAPEAMRLPQIPSTPERRAAIGTLEQRCAGVKVLTWPQRRALTDELQGAAAASGSEIQRLRAIQHREAYARDTRWNQTEATAIASAMYSGDPFLRREGFSVLLAAIDRDAPSGQERSEALLGCIAEEVINPPLSNFEALEACANLGDCGGAKRESQTAPGEGARLEALCKAAIAKRLAPLDVLAAIR